MPVGRQASVSEDRIVDFLRKHFARSAASLKMGMGDDAAVFRPAGAKELWVVTADLLLEDIDFRSSWLTPRQLGHKSLAANLSDLAAMGARPRFHVVALGLPDGFGQAWIAAFYRGMSRLGDSLGSTLIGGDLSRSSHELHVSIAALGESLNRRLLYRAGGKPGDVLFVTGTLGLSSAGLRLLESGKTSGASKAELLALRAHRLPEPRCETGVWLAQCGLVSCMMDLSDGLSADLPRLCAASEVGAEIYAASLPAFAPCAAWGFDPTAMALHGGEDFELLFAVPEKRLSAFRAGYPRGFPQITPIGRLIRRRCVLSRARPGSPARPLPALGFDHFRRRA